VRQSLGGQQADGKLIAAYSVVSLKDGTKEFRVVTQEFINRIKKASRGSNHPDSPWKHWEDQMWAKTAIRQTLKFVPLSPEDRLFKGLDVDENAFTDIGKTPIETTGVDVPDAVKSNGSSEMSSVDETLTIESEGNVVASGMDAFVQHQQAPATDDVPAEIGDDAPVDQPSTTTDPVEQPAPQPPKAQRRRRGPQPS
jgi:recombinational DNA repair protein RecT